MEEELGEGSSEFSGLKKEIAVLQGKENQAKGERLEANNAVSKMEKSIQDCTSKIPMWEKEVKLKIYICIHRIVYKLNFIPKNITSINKSC